MGKVYRLFWAMGDVALFFFPTETFSIFGENKRYGNNNISSRGMRTEQYETINTYSHDGIFILWPFRSDQ